MADQLIHFGKLSLLYENGFVRYIRTGETEIIRNIYFALRDNNWATAPIVRTGERISVTPKNFEIAYTATNVVDGIEVFRWHVKIIGSETGEVDFAVDGECLAPYNRNRAGICVLHPIRDTRNKPVHITRPDGSIYESKFPSLINPQQPFFDIRKMSWQIIGDARVELQFEGDTFETEDQRNWSDTSFKTYSTPLAVPYPVMLKRGDKVNQRVRLNFINGDNLLATDLAEEIEVTIDGGKETPFPKVGTDFPFDSNVSQEGLKLLKELKFDHLRIELVLSSSSWREKLAAGLEEAESIGVKPFIHIIISSPNEWDEFASIKLPPLVKFAISPVDRKANVDDLLRAILPNVRKLFPDADIAAGFTSYFTELNRNRFDYKLVNSVIYPVTPQAHATDTHTVIENLPAQKDQVISAMSFAPKKRVHVGPVSLKPRSNSDAKPGSKESITNRFDDRQATLLAAGWMLGSIKYLAEAGANVITMFESHGKAGFFLDDKNVYPAYNALLAVLKLNPEKVIASTCNEPLIITSLVIESSDHQRTLVLVNHTPAKKSVTVGEELYTLSEHEIRFIPLI